MEALTLTREVYKEGLQQIEDAVIEDAAYLDQFKIEFPEGINTASVMEICRVIQDSSFEGKVHILRLCIEGKSVKVTCPNGEQESFRLSNREDGLEGIPLFQKEPLALWALADTVYGFIIKKYMRPSKKARSEAEQTSDQLELKMQ